MTTVIETIRDNLVSPFRLRVAGTQNYDSGPDCAFDRNGTYGTLDDAIRAAKSELGSLHGARNHVCEIDILGTDDEGRVQVAAYVGDGPADTSYYY